MLYMGNVAVDAGLAPAGVEYHRKALPPPPSTIIGVRLSLRQRRQPFVRLLLQPRVLGVEPLLLGVQRGQPVLQLAKRGDVAGPQCALLALATERPQAALDLLLLFVDRLALALDLLDPLAVRLDLAVDLQHIGQRLVGR